MQRRMFTRVLVAGAVAPRLLASYKLAAEAAEVSKSWELCAASAVITVGTLHVPVAELRAAQNGEGRYLVATLDVSETLKGERSDAVVISFYSEDKPYSPQSTALLALDGQPVLAFLTNPQNDDSGKRVRYFAGHARDAVRAASSADVADIRAEIARQERVLRGWHSHPDWPRWTEAKALIAKTLRRDTAEQAFKDLEKLGPQAVPAIIDLMDDRRPLGVRNLVLQNPPNFFEATRIYGPQLVVDALAAILNQITATDFGGIESGGSEQERQLAVNGWRIYADIQRNHPAAARRQPAG